MEFLFFFCCRSLLDQWVLTCSRLCCCCARVGFALESLVPDVKVEGLADARVDLPFAVASVLGALERDNTIDGVVPVIFSNHCCGGKIIRIVNDVRCAVWPP